jgi:hypothetical protein
MKSDKRKSVRRPLRYTAWIARDDQPLLGCMMSDVSETGARLELDDAEAVLDEFVLMLSNRGAAKRQCKVVWREGKQIGVVFERQPSPGRPDPSAATTLPSAKPDGEHAGVPAEDNAAAPDAPVEKESA